MTAKPPLFRNADERDELRSRLCVLIAAGRGLAGLRTDPLVVLHRLAPAGSDLPLLPLAADLAQAMDTLQHAANVLAYQYDQRCRPMDDLPLKNRERFVQPPADQDGAGSLDDDDIF